jgi:hypothetical protein
VTTLQKITMGFFVYCFLAWVVLCVWKRVEVRKRRRATSYHPLHQRSASSGSVRPLNGSVAVDLESSGLKPPASWEARLAHFATLHAAFFRFGLVMFYVFICDRTTMFMKDNKYFTNLNFWLPFGYLFALGVFFTAESKFTQVSVHITAYHKIKISSWLTEVVVCF